MLAEISLERGPQRASKKKTIFFSYALAFRFYTPHCQFIPSPLFPLLKHQDWLPSVRPSVPLSQAARARGGLLIVRIERERGGEKWERKIEGEGGRKSQTSSFLFFPSLYPSSPQCITGLAALTVGLGSGRENLFLFSLSPSSRSVFGGHPRPPPPAAAAADAEKKRNVCWLWKGISGADFFFHFPLASHSRPFWK